MYEAIMTDDTKRDGQSGKDEVHETHDQLIKKQELEQEEQN